MPKRNDALTPGFCLFGGGPYVGSSNAHRFSGPEAPKTQPGFNRRANRVPKGTRRPTAGLPSRQKAKNQIGLRVESQNQRQGMKGAGKCVQFNFEEMQ